jgi:hypothetical protein
MFNARIGTLTYAELARALVDMGFVLQPKGASGHEKWIRYNAQGKKSVVTVSKHTSPFAADLIKAMAKQAEVNHRKLYAYCKKQITLQQLERT